MPHTRAIRSRRCLLGPLLLALACAHDAPRDNPLDPQLTPVVDLQVNLKDTTGAATLAWTPYEGKADFAAYWVLRNISESTRIETLEISDPRQTTHTDTALRPNTAYVYRVSVVNTDGFEQPSDEKRIDGYATGVVRVLPTESPAGAGITNVTWTRYRLPRFESYQVHRLAVGTDQDLVLTTITDVADTTFADTSARHEWDYLYSVVVRAAGQELTSHSVDGQSTLTGVTITHAEFSSPTASCSLAWTPYAGPRFHAYEVHQHLAGKQAKRLEVIPDRDWTHHIDSGLHGNTEYTYQVLVLTEADEVITSQQCGGRFHRRVADWPLEMAGVAGVRLRATEAGHVEALVSSEDEVRMLVYDTEGSHLEDDILYSRQDYVHVPGPRIAPQSVCTALGPDGQRFLSLACTDRVLVMAFTPGGGVITRDTTLFGMAMPEGVPPEEEVALRVPMWEARGSDEVLQNAKVHFGNVDVYSSGQIVWQEDFGEGIGDWDVSYASAGTNPWVEPDGALGFACALFGWEAGPVRRSDPAWREPGVEADMTMSASAAGIVTVGQLAGRRVWFSLIERHDTARLQVKESGRVIAQPEDVSLELWPWTWYRVGLWVQDGRVTASVGEPFLWIAPQEGVPRWGSMAVVEDLVAFTSGQQRNTISEYGEVLRSEQTLTASSDMRVWGSGRDMRMAVCLPDENRVLVGDARKSSWLPQLDFPKDGVRSSVVLGQGAGLEDGYLFLPLSVDRGPDGEFYVLDAGNARIQVFDAEGEYLTQWGTRGDDLDQFDFGAGYDAAASFAGSICVDGEGFIYVADVFNQRIQKFAP